MKVLGSGRLCVVVVVVLLLFLVVPWRNGPSEASAKDLVVSKKSGVFLGAAWVQEAGATEGVMPTGEFSEGQSISIGVRLFGGTDSGPKTARLRTRITKAVGGGMSRIKRDVDVSVEGSEEKSVVFSIGTLEPGTYRVRLRLRPRGEKGVGGAVIHFRVKQDD